MVEEYGDFRSIAGVMKIAESYRDYANFKLSIPPSDDIDEIFKFAYYSFGHNDENSKPLISVPRHM